MGVLVQVIPVKRREIKIKIKVVVNSDINGYNFCIVGGKKSFYSIFK